MFSLTLGVLGSDNFKARLKQDVTPYNSLTVGDLVLQQPTRWNLPLICHLFDQDTILNILSIHLVDSDMPDEIIWAPNRNEKHSIRAFYLLDYGIDFQAQMRGVWKALWSSKVHERFKIYIWSIASECLPWLNNEETY